jgi:hypothetical protein
MAYKKFDDPGVTVNQAPDKVFTAFWREEQRRAIQSFTNRIVANCKDTLSVGTSATAYATSCGTGSTCGVKVSNPVMAIINGVYGSIAAQDNIYLPAGTQGVNTYVKYLISNDFVGTNGTITAGNEGTAAAVAYLPNCPDGQVALGYFSFVTAATSIWPRVTSGAVSVLSGAGNTSGTIGTWVELVHMPINEAE